MVNVHAKQNNCWNETGTIKHGNISWICLVAKIALFCPTKIILPPKTREKKNREVTETTNSFRT